MNGPQSHRVTEINLLTERIIGRAVEIKAVERDHPLFAAQVLTYLRITGKPVGLLINFNSRLLKDGVKRMML